MKNNSQRKKQMKTGANIFITILFLLVFCLAVPATAESVASRCETNTVNGVNIAVIGLGIILGCIAILMTKRNYEIKQKLRETDRILSDAKSETEELRRKYDAMAKRLENECEQIDQMLRQTYEEKHNEIKDRFNRLKAPYKETIRHLKTRNVELKETIAQLMKALKERNQL